MQLTLNIDSSNVGTTIEQVFTTLSDEERRELAKTVMLETLRTPMDAERAAFERSVITTLKDESANSTYPSDRITTDEQARQHYKYRDRMSKFKSSSDRMMEEITKAAIANYKDLVVDLVKNDEQLAEKYAALREQLVANFPQLVQNAMIAHFASQMGMISTALSSNYQLGCAVNNLATAVQGQLASQGVNIAVPMI